MKKINMDNLILAALFISPCGNVLVFRTGILDLKILQIIWGIIIILLLVERADKKNILDIKNYNQQKSKLLFALYFTALFMSSLFSVNILMSFKEMVQYVYLFIIMYVIYTKAQDLSFMDKAIATIIKSNIVFVLICLLSYIAGKPLLPALVMLPNGMLYINDQLVTTNILVESGKAIIRLNGVLGMGATAIANCALIHAVFIQYKIRTTSGRERTLLILLLLANFATMVLTYSRAGLLLFLCFNLFCLLSKDQMKNTGIIILSLCGVLMFLAVFPNVMERLKETFNPQEQSFRYHLVYWLIALKLGLSDVLTGVGLGNAAHNHHQYTELFYKFRVYETNSVSVHNFLLQIWAEQGIPGVVINSILIFGPIVSYLKAKYKWKLQPANLIYDYVMIAYVATLLFNMTNNNFYVEIFWSLLGLVYVAKGSFAQNHCLNRKDLIYQFFVAPNININANGCNQKLECQINEVRL